MKFVANTVKQLFLGLILCAGVLSNHNGLAQFTYFNVGMEYGFMPIETNKVYTSQLSILHQYKVNAGAMHRPIRNLGIGVNVSVPLAQTNNFSFADSRAVGGNFRGWEWSTFGSEARYKPNSINHQLRQNVALSVFGRIYFARELLLFVDLKYTYSAMDELFELRRSAKPAEFYSNGDLRYPAVQGLNISHEERRSLSMPGAAVGYSLPLGDYLIFDVQIGADLLFFGSGGFQYPVTFDYNENAFISEPYALLESKAQGTKVLMSLGFGLSYLF